MYHHFSSLADFDPSLWEAMEQERLRQEQHIELIASENYTSPRVMAAQGSYLTNKYAEGYPGKRYYGGCEYVDVVEELAIERAKKLFGATYANVQPHSGSQANSAVFFALASPGDVILGMDLNEGGHLTHGCSVNFSGRHFKSYQYGLNKETGDIDYDAVAELARAHKPTIIVAGFSAYSLVIDWQRFRKIADEVGAYLVADMAHVAGLVAVGLYPSPIKAAHVTTTTTHKTLRGPRGGLILMGDEDETLAKKLNMAVFPGNQGGPLMHVIAAKAVAFQEALEPSFKTYQQQVLTNAQHMVKVLQSRGYRIVSDGTKNHLFLIDLLNKDYSGKEADLALDRANITVNKNTVPGETRSPFVTSGLRLGTPAITTRGFKEEEVGQLAHWISDILDNMGDEKVIQQVKEKVLALTAKFPVY